MYTPENASEFNLNSYDYIVDAIDSLSCKIELLSNGVNSSAKLFSSFGAASKMDPTRIQVKQIWKTYGCPLGRLVRNGLRKRRINKKFLCVFSDEVLPSHDIECTLSEQSISGLYKKQINGSVTHITGMFGFTLAGLVIKDITGM